MLVVFSSDYSHNDGGFSLTWTFLNESDEGRSYRSRNITIYILQNIAQTRRVIRQRETLCVYVARNGREKADVSCSTQT